jgi:hypothetical protein
MVAALSRLLGKQTAQRAPEPDERADSSIFPATSQPLLIAIADAIVPGDGEHPAASEIDIVPRLELWVRSTPGRLHLYRREWRLFEAGLRLRLSFARDRTNSEVLIPLFEQWLEAFRTQPAPDGPVRFFEELRRDVLRVYYASPAGWASLGYAGPAYGTHPIRGNHP